VTYKFSNKLCGILIPLRERNQWGDPRIDGRIILRQIFRKWDVGVWTGLKWLRIDRWRALVNAVMNLRGP
jgi:hypothetical protein